MGNKLCFFFLNLFLIKDNAKYFWLIQIEYAMSICLVFSFFSKIKFYFIVINIDVFIFVLKVDFFFNVLFIYYYLELGKIWQHNFIHISEFRIVCSFGVKENHKIYYTLIDDLLEIY